MKNYSRYLFLFTLLVFVALAQVSSAEENGEECYAPVLEAFQQHPLVRGTLDRFAGYQNQRLSEVGSDDFWLCLEQINVDCKYKGEKHEIKAAATCHSTLLTYVNFFFKAELYGMGRLHPSSNGFHVLMREIKMTEIKDID